jgi:serine/threonine protein kinase
MEPDDDNTQSYIALTKGTMVSHYRIIQKIGAGGMGVVYLADDTELDRKVALKFLPPHLCQDEDCRKRFKREAQAAAKLSHPNIIHVYEVSEYQGRPFFAMEHVEGRSLREFTSGKDLSIEQVLELGIQICEGLNDAHEKGVTHRDIKPSNILIDSHSRVKIVDFGLASVVGSDQLTKTGSTLGTIGYMSPEQVRGKEIDHRTDLFSLGVVLYELITKQNPFKLDSEAATLKAVCDDTPHPVARYRADVPDGLQAIIDRALEKDKSTRYQTAADLLADAKRLPRDTSAPHHVALPEKKHPLQTLLIVLSAIIVLAIGIVGVINLTRDDDVSRIVSAFSKVTACGDVDKCDLAPDGTYFAYSRVLNENRTIVMVSDIEGGTPLQVLESDRVFSLEWSPDGQELLVETGDDSSMTAYIVTRFGTTLRHFVVADPPSDETLLWHPDGVRLLFMTGDSNVVTIDRQTGDTTSVKLPVTAARLLDYSPASDLILMLSYSYDGGGFLSIVRPDGTGFQRLIESVYWVATFSAKGDAVYYAEWAGAMNRLMRLPIDPNTGRPLGEPEVLNPSIPRSFNLSVSGDGRRLLMRQRIASSNLHKVLLSPDRGQTLATTEALTSGTGFHSMPAISPDGKQIALVDFTADSAQVFVIPVDGGERRQLTFSGFMNFPGDWSPDGRQVAYFRMLDITGKDVKLCVADITSGSSRDIVNHSIMACTPGFTLDWAPAGTIVTKAPYCAGIWLVDPESGDTTTLSLADSDVDIRSPHFSPDTSLVAFHWDQDGQESDGIWTTSLIDNKVQFIANYDAHIFGWHPEGRWIYFHHMDEDNLLNIARVHYQSAEVQVLAVLQWEVPNSYSWIDLAPDASWAVIEKETRQTDVWLIEDFDPYAN